MNGLVSESGPAELDVWCLKPTPPPISPSTAHVTAAAAAAAAAAAVAAAAAAAAVDFLTSPKISSNQNALRTWRVPGW